MAKCKIANPIQLGDRFGRWQVVEEGLGKTLGKATKAFPSWICQCDCGTQREVLQMSLRSGASRSCGCWNRERSIAVNSKHGATLGGGSTPEYDAWKAIIDRCCNPNNKRFSDYGGRGIMICDEWRRDFSAFLTYVGKRPSPKHSIDRMNNERGYEPGNVRWTTSHRQMTNRRNSRFVDVDGERVPLSDLAAKSVVPANTLRWRLLKGWPLQTAMLTPARPKLPNGHR